jgi:hypothetical protein
MHQNALVLVPFREFGYLYRSSRVVYCNKSVNGLISLCFITGLSIFYPDVNKISIELLKALETLASTVTTLPRGIVSIKTLFTRMCGDHSQSGARKAQDTTSSCHGILIVTNLIERS